MQSCSICLGHGGAFKSGDCPIIACASGSNSSKQIRWLTISRNLFFGC